MTDEIKIGIVALITVAILHAAYARIFNTNIQL